MCSGLVLNPVGCPATRIASSSSSAMHPQRSAVCHLISSEPAYFGPGINQFNPRAAPTSNMAAHHYSNLDGLVSPT